MTLAREALQPIINLLRDDVTLGGMLFEDTAAINAFDTRVWAAETGIPDDIPRAEEIRDTLPRILVDVTGSPWEAEQYEADYEAATLRVYTHVFVENGERSKGEAMRDRVIRLLAGTPLAGTSIMGAPFVLIGTPRPVAEPAMRDAWRFTVEHMVGIAEAVS